MCGWWTRYRATVLFSHRLCQARNVLSASSWVGFAFLPSDIFLLVMVAAYLKIPQFPTPIFAIWSDTQWEEFHNCSVFHTLKIITIQVFFHVRTSTKRHDSPYHDREREQPCNTSCHF